MRVDPRDARHIEARIGLPRALLASVLLAVLVVVAAGITGAAHVTGARWVPHLGSARPKPPSRQSAPAQPIVPQHPPAHTHFNPLPSALLWVVVGLAAIAAAVILYRWWTGRPSRGAGGVRAPAVEQLREMPVEPEPEPEAPVLLSGIELALQVLDEQREPADAIVRAWLGLEQTAEESGIVRRPSETPTEFTSRILSGAFADDTAVRTLLRLYLRTRFGDHPVTAEDVAAVREALEGLVQSWRAPDTATGVGAR